MTTADRVTTLLNTWRDPAAREELFALIHPELRRIAAVRLRRERSGHTLQPTALVSEAFLKLVHAEAITWSNRAHFFAVASDAMRKILVDHARKRVAAKRPQMSGQSVNSDDFGSTDSFEQLIQINELLDRLKARNERVSEVFQLHYFGGMTFDEIGEIVGISSRVAKRDWKLARGWLYAALSGTKASDESGG
ncbi:MAG: ECF-type sigma factor [Bryobacteraceae bacterium]